MNTTSLTPAEDVELTLIQSDANDLIRALVGPKGSDAGILSYPTMGLVGLVTEESFQYLSRVSSESTLRAPEAELFSRFAGAVTKSRARIKLFDDTEGYADGLVEALSVAHDKSVGWFCEPHRGLLRSWLRRFQPDLGMFFAGENLIATTHTALPGIGLHIEELKSLTPAALKDLGQRLYAFSYQVGVYLSQLATLFGPFGKPIDLEPEPVTTDLLRLSRNDFVGAKVYESASNALRLTEQRFVSSVFMALAQINAALHVFPQLLGQQSNLLVRFQVLTAYHASGTLELAAPRVMAAMPAFSEAERRILRSRNLRNACAHYGLRHAAASAVGADDPFGAVVFASAYSGRT